MVRSPSSSRRGFTLIEMVVTVVVLLILTSLGIFGVSAVLERSDASLTRTDLQAVRTAQLRFAGVYGTFTPHGPDLSSNEVSPNVWELTSLDVTITDGASTAEGVISFAVGDDGSLGLAALTSSGDCVGLQVPAANTPGASVEFDLDEGAICEGRAVLPDGAYQIDPTVSYRW